MLISRCEAFRAGRIGKPMRRDPLQIPEPAPLPPAPAEPTPTTAPAPAAPTKEPSPV